MKNLILNLTTFMALILSASAALAHPSVHHTGEEGIMHEAAFALIVLAAFAAGLAYLKKIKSKRQ